MRKKTTNHNQKYQYTSVTSTTQPRSDTHNTKREDRDEVVFAIIICAALLLGTFAILALGYRTYSSYAQYYAQHSSSHSPNTETEYIAQLDLPDAQ